MITPLGWIERVPTYKEKQQQLKDRDVDTYGFLGYPRLQTTDISIYREKCVPVGVDQAPHLEISRKLRGDSITSTAKSSPKPMRF